MTEVCSCCKTISGRRSRPRQSILSLEQPWKRAKAPHKPWSEALEQPWKRAKAPHKPWSEAPEAAKATSNQNGIIWFWRPHTVKRVDGKLRQPARMTQYSSIRGTEHFFYMLIELIRRFPTMKMDYFEAQWNFPTVFVLTHRSFPTIFRQLSDAWIKIKFSSTTGARSMSF